MNTLTVAAPDQTDIVTTARRVLPGDILLDVNGVPVVLVTRARTRLTSVKQVTQIEGEWLVRRPLGTSSIFRRSTLSTSTTYVRRAA
jgi:hypothetical protein